MSESFSFNYSTVPVIVDEYKLPPLMVITEGPISWILSQALNKKHARYLAAQIILGQPFNLPFRDLK